MAATISISHTVPINSSRVAGWVNHFVHEAKASRDQRLRFRDRRPKVLAGLTTLADSVHDEDTMQRAVAAAQTAAVNGSNTDALKAALRAIFDAAEARAAERGRDVFVAILNAAETILLDTAIFDLLVALVFRGLV